MDGPGGRGGSFGGFSQPGTPDVAGSRFHQKAARGVTKQPPDPESQRKLLEALDAGDLAAFQQLLDSGSVEPSFRYVPPFFSKFGTCLEIACRTDGRAAFVQALLDKGVRPNNVVLPEPIHYAAKYGQADSLAALLRDGKTRVNAVDSAGRTALHLVAEHFREARADDFRRCAALLAARRDFNVDAADNRGLSAAHAAAATRNRAAFTSILDECRLAGRTLDLDAAPAGGDGLTARQLAQQAFPDVRLPAAAPPLDDLAEQLLSALSGGDPARYRQLLSSAAAARGFDPNLWLDEPLSMRLLEAACRLPSHRVAPQLVRFTLAAGADPNATNLKSHRAVLHVAAEEGNEAVVKCLLEHEALDVNAQDRDGVTPLMAALDAGQWECAALLTRHPAVAGAAADARGRTALHYAAGATPADAEADDRDAAEDCLRRLLALPDVAPGATDAEGRAPADVAACQWVRDVIADACVRCPTPPVRRQLRTRAMTQQPTPWQRLFDLLVAGDSDAFIREVDSLGEQLLEILDDSTGQYTLLQFATIRSQVEAVRTLLEKDVDPNAVGQCDKNASPPLVIACQQSGKSKDNTAAQLTRLLLDAARTDVNAKDTRGYTALHFASKNGDLDTVVELLNRGANIRAKSSFGEYPLGIDEVEVLLTKSITSTEDCLPTHPQYVIKFDFKLVLADVRSGNTAPLAKILHLEKKDVEATLVRERTKRIGSKRRLYSEMRFLRFLSLSQDHQEVLQHPLIKTFLYLKYKRVSWMIFFNFIMYLLYVLSFNFFIWAQYGHHDTPDERIKTASNIMTWITLVPIAVREFFQMFHPKSYFKNIANFKDLLMISGTIYTLLVAPLSGIGLWWTTATILLSWFELLWLCGRFQTHAMYIEMFKAVLQNYGYFLAIFSLIILAFSFSFYVVFTSDIGSVDRNETEIETVRYFSNPLLALYKIVNMMAGDMAPDITLNLDVVLACLVVMLFMFFLPIVLLNLLTALAVSDEQKIRENAAVLSLTSQINCLYEMEKIASRHFDILKTLKISFLYRRIRKVWLFLPGAKETRLDVWPNRGRYGKLITGAGENKGDNENDALKSKINIHLLEETKELLADQTNTHDYTRSEQVQKLVEHLRNIQAEIQKLKQSKS